MIKKGDNNTPTVHGVAYFGCGSYTTYTKCGKTTIYSRWKTMIRRCYDKNHQDKNPTYKGCSVCGEWLNFQNFAQWFEDNYYEIEGESIELDKDILVRGNKVYSPETCCFVPRSINSLLTYSKNNNTSLPHGVTKREYGERYASRVVNPLTKKNESCGVYDTVEEAFLAYKNKKEAIIKEVAEKYKRYIRNDVYEALCNWSVDF